MNSEDIDSELFLAVLYFNPDSVIISNAEHVNYYSFRMISKNPLVVQDKMARYYVDDFKSNDYCLMNDKFILSEGAGNEIIIRSMKSRFGLITVDNNSVINDVYELPGPDKFNSIIILSDYASGELESLVRLSHEKSKQYFI